MSVRALAQPGLIVGIGAVGLIGAASSLGGLACSGSSDRTTETDLPVVYGADDRLEYYDVAMPGLRDRLAGSMVALMTKSLIGSAAAGYPLSASTWGQLAGLCPGTRFADQPAAALCSGVLLDRDLVLTADHCLRVFALEDLAVVFGYYYSAPGTLAIDDVQSISSIVAERLDPEGSAPRLDFALIKMAGPAKAQYQPAPVQLQASAIAGGTPLVSIGTGGGLPLKLDAGGEVRDARQASGDYFVADTDTFEGGSGGGAFDSRGTLLGILARGGNDFVSEPAGCSSVTVAPSEAAEEQFTYATRAVEELCSVAPGVSSLCRRDCGSPCVAAPSRAPGDAGCSIAATGRLDLVGLLIAACTILAAGRRPRTPSRGYRSKHPLRSPRAPLRGR